MVNNLGDWSLKEACQGFIQDFTLEGGHFFGIVYVCKTDVMQIMPF